MFMAAGSLFRLHLWPEGRAGHQIWPLTTQGYDGFLPGYRGEKRDKDSPESGMGRPTPVIPSAVLAMVVAALFLPIVTSDAARRLTPKLARIPAVSSWCRAAAEVLQVRPSVIEASKARGIAATRSEIRRTLRCVLYRKHKGPYAPRA